MQRAKTTRSVLHAACPQAASGPFPVLHLCMCLHAACDALHAAMQRDVRMQLADMQRADPRRAHRGHCVLVVGLERAA